MNIKLYSFRKYHNWELEEVANQLAIAINDYKQFENGEIKIDWDTAQKLADLYNAPVESFINDNIINHLRSDVMFTNCTFNGNCSGYVNHQYNNGDIDIILNSKNEEIKSLKEQIVDLRRQNDKLLALLEKGRN